MARVLWLGWRCLLYIDGAPYSLVTGGIGFAKDDLTAPFKRRGNGIEQNPDIVIPDVAHLLPCAAPFVLCVVLRNPHNLSS